MTEGEVEKRLVEEVLKEEVGGRSLPRGKWKVENGRT